MTRALDSAAAALTESEPQRYPVVRVAALPTAAGGLLAQAIARLRARRPHAGVRVQTGHNPELLAALRAGEADFAVGRIAEPATMTGVSFELLYAESLAVVTRPEHRLAGLAPACCPVSVLSLLSYPLVIPSTGTAPRHDVEGLFEAQGIALPPGRTETQSVSVARALTLPSDTVWITPQHTVQLDLRPGLAAQAQRPDAGQRRAGRHPVEQRDDPGRARPAADADAARARVNRPRPIDDLNVADLRPRNVPGPETAALDPGRRQPGAKPSLGRVGREPGDRQRARERRNDGRRKRHIAIQQAPLAEVRRY